VPGRVTHIAVNADDDGATRAFYEALFEWRFELYYPGFVRTPLPAADEMVAAVQKRRGCFRASAPMGLRSPSRWTTSARCSAE
jgi:predicted enzyme related to lactoylglutathione lyase